MNLKTTVIFAELALCASHSFAVAHTEVTKVPRLPFMRGMGFECGFTTWVKRGFVGMSAASPLSDKRKVVRAILSATKLERKNERHGEVWHKTGRTCTGTKWRREAFRASDVAARMCTPPRGGLCGLRNPK